MQDGKVLELMQQGQEKHYKDDDVRFEMLIRNGEKHEELMRIAGEHMSHIRKAMNEMQTLLEHNSEKIDEERLLNEAHRKRVEPMLVSFEDSKRLKVYLDGKGETAIKWGMVITAVTIIGAAVVWIIKVLVFNTHVN